MRGTHCVVAALLLCVGCGGEEEEPAAEADARVRSLAPVDAGLATEPLPSEAPDDEVPEWDDAAEPEPEPSRSPRAGACSAPIPSRSPSPKRSPSP